MNEELEAVLDQYVRPQLRGHGGDLEVLSVEDVVRESSGELLEQARAILRARHGG